MEMQLVHTTGSPSRPDSDMETHYNRKCRQKKPPSELALQRKQNRRCKKQMSERQRRRRMNSSLDNLGLLIYGKTSQEGLKVDKATLLKDAFERLQTTKDDYYKGYQTAISSTKSFLDSFKSCPQEVKEALERHLLETLSMHKMTTAGQERTISPACASLPQDFQHKMATAGPGRLCSPACPNLPQGLQHKLTTAGPGRSCSPACPNLPQGLQHKMATAGPGRPCSPACPSLPQGLQQTVGQQHASPFLAMDLTCDRSSPRHARPPPVLFAFHKTSNTARPLVRRERLYSDVEHMDDHKTQLAVELRVPPTRETANAYHSVRTRGHGLDAVPAHRATTGPEQGCLTARTIHRRSHLDGSNCKSVAQIAPVICSLSLQKSARGDESYTKAVSVHLDDAAYDRKSMVTLPCISVTPSNLGCGGWGEQVREDPRASSATLPPLFTFSTPAVRAGTVPTISPYVTPYAPQKPLYLDLNPTGIVYGAGDVVFDHPLATHTLSSPCPEHSTPTLTDSLVPSSFLQGSISLHLGQHWSKAVDQRPSLCGPLPTTPACNGEDSGYVSPTPPRIHHPVRCPLTPASQCQQPASPLARCLVYRPNIHGPNDHGPNDHGPNDHGPNDHGPNDHGPDAHGPNDHGPNDHGPDAQEPLPETDEENDREVERVFIKAARLMNVVGASRSVL